MREDLTPPDDGRAGEFVRVKEKRRKQRRLEAVPREVYYALAVVAVVFLLAVVLVEPFVNMKNLPLFRPR